MTMKSFLSCLRDAERLYQEGQRGRVIKKLEAALRELRNPPQGLPTWVKPGARLVWKSVFKQTISDTMVVTEVHRERPDWWFRTERRDADGGISSVSVIERSVGKRNWKRYVA
jgi:hypothetical protein